jgi:hypothetical protein
MTILQSVRARAAKLAREVRKVSKDMGLTDGNTTARAVIEAAMKDYEAFSENFWPGIGRGIQQIQFDEQDIPF